MTTIREAYRAFTDFSDRQKQTVQSIKTEIREGKAQIADEKKILKDRIAEKFPTLESFPVDFLTEISQEAGTERNFSLLLASMERGNEELAQRRQALIDAHGTPEKLAREARSLNSAVLTRRTEEGVAEEASLELQYKLSGFRPYMEELRDEDGMLKEETLRDAVEGFKKKSFGKVFSPTWWSGHAVVKEYESKGGDIVADWISFRDQKKALHKIKDDLSAKEKRLDVIRRAEESMRELEYAAKTPEQIVEALRERMFDAVFDDKFMDVLARKVEENDVAPLAEPVLKIANLTKINANLGAALKATETLLDTINEPIPKLRRGASQAGSQRIKKLDLKEIDSAVAGHEAFAHTLTGNARRARTAIGDYSYKSSSADTVRGSGDSLTMNMMNVALLTTLIDSPDVDNAFLNQTLSDFPVPDSSSPSSLSDAFNEAATGFSAPEIQTPEFNINVPTIEMPSIDIPTIDIPSIDTSSIGGGFDGGFSGGGFD